MKKSILIFILLIAFCNAINATLTTPGIVSPSNGATGQAPNVQLNWSSVSGATFYEIMYDVNSSFTNPIIGQTSNLTYNTNVLQNGTTYYWKVRAGNGAGYSPWSVVWTFTTEVLDLDAPELISPPYDAINIPLEGIMLQWGSVPGATIYSYMCDDDIFFNSAICGSTSELYAFTGNLAADTRYYWKVIASNGSIDSPWSAVWTFTTESGDNIINLSNYNISIYPNPANTSLEIEFHNDLIKLINISLIDMDGKIVWIENNVSQNLLQIDVSSMSTGKYTLKIYNSDEILTYPIVIIH